MSDDNKSALWSSAKFAHDESLPDEVRQDAAGAATEMAKEQGNTPPALDGSTTRS